MLQSKMWKEIRSLCNLCHMIFFSPRTRRNFVQKINESLSSGWLSSRQPSRGYRATPSCDLQSYFANDAPENREYPLNLVSSNVKRTRKLLYTTFATSLILSVFNPRF